MSFVWISNPYKISGEIPGSLGYYVGIVNKNYVYLGIQHNNLGYFIIFEFLLKEYLKMLKLASENYEMLNFLAQIFLQLIFPKLCVDIQTYLTVIKNY